MKMTPRKDWTAARVMQLRRRLHMTALEFSRCLGTTETSLSRWENGHATPRLATARRLDALEAETKAARSPTTPSAGRRST
jgi:DNA-binding transcriptional regulator YiaG